MIGSSSSGHLRAFFKWLRPSIATEMIYTPDFAPLIERSARPFPRSVAGPVRWFCEANEHHCARCLRPRDAPARFTRLRWLLGPAVRFRVPCTVFTRNRSGTNESRRRPGAAGLGRWGRRLRRFPRRPALVQDAAVTAESLRVCATSRRTKGRKGPTERRRPPTGFRGTVSKQAVFVRKKLHTSRAVTGGLSCNTSIR